MTRASRRLTYRPCLEALEDRCVPSTFTVKNLFDDASKDCLRSLITKANNHLGADTIVFAPGLEGTIPLIFGDIGISDSLVLTGPGAAKITVDGLGLDRIFSVDDGDSSVSRNVTIQGLALFNGFVPVLQQELMQVDLYGAYFGTVAAKGRGIAEVLPVPQVFEVRGDH